MTLPAIDRRQAYTNDVETVAPVTVCYSGDLCEIILVGPLGVTDRTKVYSEAQRALRNGYKRIRVNCARCESLDGSAFGALIAATKRAREVGGTLELVDLSEGVSWQLAMTKLAEQGHLSVASSFPMTGE